MHTHSSEHTPRAVGSHISAAPGEQLGVWCLAQGSHLSRGIEGGESTEYSLPPLTIPAGPEARTRDLRVTSPTLYPLGRDCPKKVYKSIQTQYILNIKLHLFAHSLICSHILPQLNILYFLDFHS